MQDETIIWGWLPSELAVAVTWAANAATVSYDVTFSATNFTSAFGQAAPTDPVTGSFRITFDPTQTYTDDTSDITWKSLNIALRVQRSPSTDSPTGNGDGAADELVVGGVSNGAATVQYNPPTR